MRTRLSPLLAVVAAMSAASCQQILGLEDGVPAPTAPPSTPAAQVATDPIDFGLADCGADAPATRTLQLRNTGTAKLEITASLGATPVFSLTSPASVSVAAGASASLTVSAAVPQATAPASTFSTTLTLKSNDPKHASITVPLKVTAQGGALTLGAPQVSFGVMAVGAQVPSVPVTLTNVGNAAVKVSLGKPSDTEFSGTYTGAPGAVSLAPNTTLPGLTASWTPGDAMTHQSAIPIVVDGAVCGASVTAIPVAGQGTNGVFTASTSALFFGPQQDGNVDCGTTAGPRQLSIGNAGNMPYSWTSTIGAGFSVAPSSGTVPANQMVTLTVTPLTGIPAQSATTPDLYADALTITTDAAGEQPHVIALHQTAHGAVLALTPSATLDIGGVLADTTGQAPFTVQNLGNAPAGVTLAATGTSFGVSPAGPTTIAAADSLMATATFSPGTSIALQNGGVTVAVDPSDVLCAPLPSLALTGTGLDGVVGASTAALDFGVVDCGATAAPQVVTFTNTGTADYTITPTLGKGAVSPYALTLSPASGVVTKGGGTATITVTPAAVPFPSEVTPNLYGDLLTVTTTAVGDAPHYLPITQTAGGAIITVERSSINFGSTGTNIQYNLAVNNIGNEPMDVYTTLQTPSNSYQGNFTAVTFNPGDSHTFPVLFQPAQAPFDDVLNLVPTNLGPHRVLCKPLAVSAVTLQGAPAYDVVTIGVSPGFSYKGIEFPPTACGAVPPGQFTITVNAEALGPPGITVTAALVQGTNFAVTPASALIPSGGEFTTFTVTALKIPAVSSTLLHAFSDTVILTTSVTGSPARRVFITGTASGAVLSVNEAAAAFPDTLAGQTTTANGAFYILNTGNSGVPITALSLTDATDFSAAPTVFTPIPYSPYLVTSTFKPATPGMKSTGVTLVPGAGPLCGPLPPALTLKGNAN